MTIDPKYLAFFVVIFGLCARLWYKINRSDERVCTMEAVVFLEKGGLNIVTNEVLDKTAKGIEKSIEREANITAKVLERLECLDYNVTELMIFNNLKPRRVKPTGDPVTYYQKVE